MSRIFLCSFSGVLADLHKGKRTTENALKVLARDGMVSTFDLSEFRWLDRLVRDIEAQGLVSREILGYPWWRFVLTDAGKAALAQAEASAKA